MADGCVPIVLSPEPFSREVAYLEQPAGRTLRAALLDAVKSGSLSADDLSRTVVYIDGRRLERDETLDHVLTEGEIVNIVVEPLGGGGRKDVGQILMTIAVIAVSMWVGGGGTVLGTTLLARVAAAAILTLGQAAVAALFAPENNQAKVNERYALQTAANQYRPWAPMPLALGEVVAAPDFAAKTYTQSVGDDVWLHGILGLHYGPCTVADLKIGDTLASSMGAGDFRMVQHLAPGPRTFTIYPNDVDQLDLQEELEATTAVATTIVRASSSEGERFDFDFFLPGGLHFQKDDGRLLVASVTVTIRYRPVDQNGNPIGGGAWTNGLTVALSSTTKEPMRVTRSLPLAMGRYEFEFRRSVKPDNNDKRRDRIALTAIRSIAYRKPIADETLSVIEFAVRATALNQGTLAPITCRIIPICETWNGDAWGAPEPTSNPAALTRWLMTGPAPARPLLPAQADTRLRTWAQLCDQYDWRAGIYLLEERRQDQVLALLEQAGRASLFWDGTQIVASTWVEKPAPRQLFSGSNLRDHRWTLVYPEPVHALRVEFQNIAEGGDPDELYVYMDGYAETAGDGKQAATLIEALRLEGQKTPERAYRDGRWELGARLHRRRIDTWTADAEHLVSSYGDRVRLAWQRVDGGMSSRIRCRRWSGGLVSGLRLAQPVEMKPGESYAVDIRLPSGVALAVPVINEAGAEPIITREVQFAVPREPGSSPKRDDLIAFGVPSRISEDTEIIGVEPGEGLTAVLTGVRYVAPLLMAGETGPIPPLQTRLTRQRQASPPAPRLLGVQPDPAGVRVSFDMPPWTGSPVVGFSARWRPTPPEGTETGWQALNALPADAREGLIPSPRAVPVAPDDVEGRNLVDYELRAVTAAGQTSPEPMTLTSIEVREDPFVPLGLTVTPATRVAPGGSSHGVLVASVNPLAAGVGTDVILEVRRAPLSGAPDEWESAGLPLTSVNPTGDILGLRSGERYGVRAALRSPAGWTSDWTEEVRETVPAGSNVSDDTVNVGGIATGLFVDRVVDVEDLAAANSAAVADLVDVYGDTASAAASAAAAALAEAETAILAAAAAGSASSAATSASGAIAAESGAASSAAAASTSATNASTAAGAASTSATQASNSAATADGHRAAAATSETNAANSAGVGGGHASAAAGSASSASTSATNASNSAAAASASQVAAFATYGATVLVGGNNYFDQGLTGWSVGGPASAVANLGGRRNVIAVPPGTVCEVYSEKVWPVDTSRKYRVRGAAYAGAGTGEARLYIGFRGIDAGGNVLISDPPSYTYSAAAYSPITAGAGWVEFDSLAPGSPIGGVPITGEGSGWAAFPAGTKGVQLLILFYESGGACERAADYIELEDITESVSAGTSASAAATQASSAAASATEAGGFATAASGSATTAATQASSASSFASQASTSAGNAASSSSSAGTSASNAAASAATASTQASNAGASASSAQSSATLAASISAVSLLANSRFTDWSAPLTFGYLPRPWGSYDSSNAFGNISQVAGETPDTSAMRMDGPAGVNVYIGQISSVGSVAPLGWYVVESDFRLDAGTLEGAGTYTPFLDFAAVGTGTTATQFRYDPNNNTGAPIGLGVIGQIYRFAKLIQAPANTTTSRLGHYAMSHWAGLGDLSAANQLTWFKNSVRPATPGEIAAGTVLPALSANVATIQSVQADHATQYSLARYSVAATTPSGAAILSLVSSTYGTVAGLTADQIWFGENTFFDNATDTLRTITGANARVIALGASFGTDGQLTEWEGPAATAFSAMSRTNAYFYRANVAPFVDAPVGLPSAGGAPGGSGAKPLVGASASTVATSGAFSSVAANSLISMTAEFFPHQLDAPDATIYGNIIFEESTGGTWAQIGSVAVQASSESLSEGGGYNSSGSVSAQVSGFGTRTGSVIYRAGFVRTGGANLYGGGYTMSGSVAVTPPAA